LMNKATSSFVPAADGPVTCPAPHRRPGARAGAERTPPGDGTRPELSLNAPPSQRNGATSAVRTCAGGIQII